MIWESKFNDRMSSSCSSASLMSDYFSNSSTKGKIATLFYLANMLIFLRLEFLRIYYKMCWRIYRWSSPSGYPWLSPSLHHQVRHHAMNIFAALFLHLLTFFTLTMLIPTSKYLSSLQLSPLTVVQSHCYFGLSNSLTNVFPSSIFVWISYLHFYSRSIFFVNIAHQLVGFRCWSSWTRRVDSLGRVVTVWCDVWEWLQNALSSLFPHRRSL